MLGLLAIYSDEQGHPNRNGGHGHIVVVSDEPVPNVAQMQLPLGLIDAVACAVACTLSVGLVFGKTAIPSTVLADEHTSFPNGTDLQYVPPTLAALFAITSHVEHGDPSGKPWVMNPAWGGRIPPAGFAAYLAASQHVMVIVDGAAVVDNPQPTGGTPLTQGDDDMPNIEAIDWTERGQQSEFEVTDAHILEHRFYVDGHPGQQKEYLAVGINPKVAIKAVHHGNGEVHVYARKDDGTDLHWWEAATGSAQSENLS